jgi:hypothetical protein
LSSVWKEIPAMRCDRFQHQPLNSRSPKQEEKKIIKEKKHLQ